MQEAEAIAARRRDAGGNFVIIARTLKAWSSQEVHHS